MFVLSERSCKNKGHTIRCKSHSFIEDKCMLPEVLVNIMWNDFYLLFRNRRKKVKVCNESRLFSLVENFLKILN